MVSGQKQVTPSLVDVASSAERLSKLSVTEDRVKHVSSDLAHARTSAIATADAAAADAAAEARHEASVRRVYVTIGQKDVARISALLFSHLYTSITARNNSIGRIRQPCRTFS